MKTESERKVERWRIYLFNSKTRERRAALAKHAEMLSRHEAQAIVRRTKGRMGEWEYKAEPLKPALKLAGKEGE